MKHTIYLSRNSDLLNKVFFSIPVNLRTRFPENSLHPAEFVKIIPNLLQFESSTYIFTNSDVLVGHIGEMIDKGKANPEDFEIVILSYNEDNTNTKSEKKTIKYDEKGYLINFPYGFFSPLDPLNSFAHYDFYVLNN